MSLLFPLSFIAGSRLPHQTRSSVSQSLSLPHKPGSFWRGLAGYSPRVPKATTKRLSTSPSKAPSCPPPHILQPLLPCSSTGPHWLGCTSIRILQVLKAKTRQTEAREGNVAMMCPPSGHALTPRHGTEYFGAVVRNGI